MARKPRRQSARNIWPPVWRRHPIAAVLLLIVVIGLTWNRMQVPFGSDYDRYHNQIFTCTHVVDGDTLDIAAPDGKKSTTRIRLWGVDTPETAASPRGSMYYGTEASAFTREQAEGKPVRVVMSPDRARDRYNRLLAYIYLPDETMLNEEIIASGHGYADRRFDHVWKVRFIDLEKRAIKDERGLWKKITVEQMPEWRQRYETWQTEMK